MRSTQLHPIPEMNPEGKIWLPPEKDEQNWKMPSNEAHDDFFSSAVQTNQNLHGSLSNKQL